MKDHQVGYNQLISNKHWRNNLADCALLEQPEGNLMVTISWAWYNDSYTMDAKPIKSLAPIALYSDPVFLIIHTYFIHISNIYK